MSGEPGWDAVPEVLPDRDELVRAEVAAHWIATGDRGDTAEPLRIELCTRALRLPGASHEAREGQRLRLRLARATRQIGVLEEPDTGSTYVWDEFAPHELVPCVDRREAPPDRVEDDAFSVEILTSATLTVPAMVEPAHRDVAARRVRVQAEHLVQAEAVLRSLVVAVYAGLPTEDADPFLDWIRVLPSAIDALACWDLFYGRARLDVHLIAHAARTLGLRGGELAVIGALGGLARWCDETTLRCAVESIASVDAWVGEPEGPSR